MVQGGKDPGRAYPGLSPKGVRAAKDLDGHMSKEHEQPDEKIDAIRKFLMEIFPERFAQSATEEAHAFLGAIKAGDFETVRRMIQSNGDLLFIMDDYYGSPVRAATDKNAEIADFLARIELERLREGSVPKEELYGAIHDLGEAAHAETGYRGCESLRAEAEPVVAGFLAHDDDQIRYIAMSVLATHWDLKHYAQVFQSMAQSDPDEFVRQIAVSDVGWLLRGSRDHDAGRFLLGIFRDPVQPTRIREEAYEGLVEIWQGWNAAQALWARKLKQKDLLRSEAERAGEGLQAEQLSENAWKEFIDWNFVAQVEREVKDRGRL